MSVTIQESFVLQQPEHRPRDLRELPTRLTTADIGPLPMEEVDTAFRPKSSNKAELRSALGSRSGQELDDDGAECSAKIFGM